jgi:hypothetical protein
MAMYRISVLTGKLFALGLATTITLVAPAGARAQSIMDSVPTPQTGRVKPPSTSTLMTTMDATLQQAKPREIFRRTVVFGDVHAGRPNGQVYPFIVSATVHDYTPGWPRNNYYGQTCLTKIDHGAFNMRRDRLGEWAVEGRTELSGGSCVKNPSEGVSAFPLDSMAGTRVGSSVLLRPPLPTKGRAWVPKIGEWACVLPGGRLASNMGFRMKANKSYTDLEGARGGTYIYDVLASSLTFRGGFLDGRGGKNVDGDGIVLSPTLTCAPWGVGKLGR